MTSFASYTPLLVVPPAQASPSRSLRVPVEYTSLMQHVISNTHQPTDVPPDRHRIHCHLALAQCLFLTRNFKQSVLARYGLAIEQPMSACSCVDSLYAAISFPSVSYNVVSYVYICRQTASKHMDQCHIHICDFSDGEIGTLTSSSEELLVRIIFESI